jgi:hypothetical protein
VKALILAAAIAIYAAVFLYPLHWSPPHQVKNRAERTERGWRFPGPGLVRSRAPAEYPGGRFQVTLRVRSARPRQNGPARIFTISEDASLRNLTLGQEGSDLVLRARAPGTSPNGTPQQYVSGVFANRDWHTIHLAVYGDTVDLYVDGALRLRNAYDGPVTATWDRSYRMALGNELTGRRPWLGEVEWTAPMERPRRYWSLVHAPRWVPFEYVETEDLLLNVLGFVPFGVLLAVFGWPVAPALLLSAGLSAGIEFMQLGLANRYASTTDVLLNVSGALLGFLLFRRLWGKSAGGAAVISTGSSSRAGSSPPP